MRMLDLHHVRADFEQSDERTRLVALSHVAFVNGYRHDIAAIAVAAHAKGALVALDTIQSLGPMHVDVGKLGVDFLTGSSSKWMMSLPGWGILLIRKSLLEQLGQPVAGFLGLEQPEQAIRDLSGYAIEALQARGHEVRTPQAREKRAGIVNFVPRKSVPALQQKFEKEKIHVSRRGGGIRLSLHMYNPRQEIERFVEMVERLCL